MIVDPRDPHGDESQKSESILKPGKHQRHELRQHIARAGVCRFTVADQGRTALMSLERGNRRDPTPEVEPPTDSGSSPMIAACRSMSGCSARYTAPIPQPSFASTR